MTVRVWRTLVASFLFAALAGASSIVYAHAVAKDAEHRWCGLVSALDDAYRSIPPQTPTGHQVAAEVNRLRGEFDCQA
jgi:hypothetical protein